MKVPLSWLREFVDITLPPAELAHILTMAGLEVGEIQYIGLEGSDLPWDREKIVIGNILEVKPHPNADRLVLADVDYGAESPHTVVTGAPNLFPYRGQGPLPHPLKSVFAREGVQLYDGHKEGKVIMTLKGRPVRGVMSDAMLCSEKELGISDDHEGIIFLEDDAPTGAPLQDVLGDVIFDLDLTPNLARCLSIVGVAREVAALTGEPLHLPDPQVPMEGPPVASLARVTVETPHLCPRFTVGVVENITLKPSPLWMQRRLRAAGMRPISNIVDISNYVMLEWGQPTHAFDADKVHNQHLVVRLAEPGEMLVTLDDKERDLTPFAAPKPGPLLVADPQGPLALAGIMGGAASEVGDSTSRVLLEGAIWEPTQVRRTAQHYKLPSEASRRFERGVDIEIPLIAQRRALQLMHDLADGTVAQGLLDIYLEPFVPLTLELPPREVCRLLGIQLHAREIADMLIALGFSAQVRGAPGLGDMAPVMGSALDPTIVEVTVPSFRQDVSNLADLCEEVARVYGYEKIPPTRLTDELPPADTHPELIYEQQIRELLTGSGLNEVITYSLTSMEEIARVAPSTAQPEHYLKLSNAITPERLYLRHSLLPTLLTALANNLNERDRVLLCEIGSVYLPRNSADAAPATPEEWLPAEPRHLALALAGPQLPATWDRPAATMFDFFDLKGIIELVLNHLGLSALAHFEPLTDDERLHPGRAARLLLTPQPAGSNGKQPQNPESNPPLLVGVLGELHPTAHERLELKTERALIAELNLDTLIDCATPATYRLISRYPANQIDLAFVVDSTVPAEQIARLIRQGAGDLLESLQLFDIYTGEQIGPGKQSLAYRLAFRAPDRTLSDEVLTKQRAKIVRLLNRELGASLRGDA